jgi:hypothetical protein
MKCRDLNRITLIFLAAAAFWAVVLCGGLYAGEVDLRLPPLKDRPDGFAGLKWGDPADKLEGYIMFSEGESGGPEQYVVPGDGRTWEGFAVDEIMFSFRRKQLVMVRLSLADSVKSDEVKEYAMKKYASPSLESKRNGGVSYVWNDDDFGVILTVNPSKKPEVSLMNHKLALELSL